MARAKDIAALAGLAGLAYAYNKSKGATDSNPARAARPESTETREDKIADEGYKNDVLKTITQKREGSNDQAGNQGVLPPKSLTPEVKPKKPVPKPAVAADEPAGLTTPVSSANRTDQLANLSRAVNREDKTSKAAQGDFRGGTTVFPVRGQPDLERQKLYDAVDEKSGSSDKSAYKTDALATASRAAAAADRQRKMAKASSYKSGGMASSASKRADGIASRGKTKCKMY